MTHQEAIQVYVAKRAREKAERARLFGEEEHDTAPETPLRSTTAPPPLDARALTNEQFEDVLRVELGMTDFSWRRAAGRSAPPADTSGGRRCR